MLSNDYFNCCYIKYATFFVHFYFSKTLNPGFLVVIGYFISKYCFLSYIVTYYQTVLNDNFRVLQPRPYFPKFLFQSDQWKQQFVMEYSGRVQP